jgi:hypothetical protein
LFVYNRPDHTRMTIEALLKNDLSDQTAVYIYSDAARNESDIPRVNEVRHYLHHLRGFSRINVIERTENWGLAKSIISGVSDLAKEYGTVIVLEDDIVTSPYFLRFMNEGLDRYADQPRVMSISGHMNQIDNSNLNESFFTYFTSCWGWATWDRAWQKFEKNPGQLISAMTPKEIKKFNLYGAENFWNQVLANHKGTINTWAVFWYSTVFQNDGLVLHPSISLTDNIGHDGSGIHCGESDRYRADVRTEPISEFPSAIENNTLAIGRIRDFYFRSKPSLMTRVGNKIQRIIRNAGT